MSRTHRAHNEVFAVIRFDPDMGAPEYQVTVKEIVSSAELAAAEVSRLNAVNADKGCQYFWQPTRLFPPGMSAGTLESESPEAAI